MSELDLMNLTAEQSNLLEKARLAGFAGHRAVLGQSAITWPQPIPVTERLPEDGESVLWWHDHNRCEGWVKGGMIEGLVVVDGSQKARPIDWFTHWLPLPPSPENPSK